MLLESGSTVVACDELDKIGRVISEIEVTEAILIAKEHEKSRN